MQLELYRLDAMQAATSCHDLWMHITNPAYFEFGKYVEEATGREIPSYGAVEVAPGGEPPEYWELARPVVDALEWSVDQLKVLLPDEPTASDVDALADKLTEGEVPAESDVDLKVLQCLLDRLSGHVSGISPLDPRPGEHLVRLP